MQARWDQLNHHNSPEQQGIVCADSVSHAREARKRERERERERQKEEREREKKKKRRAREREAGPGRENRKEGKNANETHATPDLPASTTRSWRHRAQTREERPRPTPREERGKKTEEERERGKAEPENGETKNSLDHKQKSIQKRTPRSRQEHRQINTRSSCPKTLPETNRNKSTAPKPKAKKGRTFLSPFSESEKGGFQGPKNIPEKLRTPIPKFVAKNLPRKNQRRIEL